MSSENSPPFDAELLDDFFAEADEHLLGIRQALLQLEASVDKAQADPKIVGDLFRDFHSFKGISAIVGLAPAEAVAHATEDFLRLIRSGKAQVTAKGLEILMAATRRLEQVVAAFRSRKPLPGYESLLADLQQQCDRATSFVPAPKSAAQLSNASDPGLLSQIEEAKARKLLMWKYTFRPPRH